MGREIIAVTISGAGFVSGVIFLERDAVNVNHAVTQVNTVARNADHAFYEVLRAVHRVVEHDDFTPLDIAIGQEPAYSARLAKVKLVRQQIVADEQRVLHGFGRYTECLHHEGHGEQNNHCHREHSLYSRPEIPGRSFRWRWNQLGERRSHTSLGCERRWSSACLAAKI